MSDRRASRAHRLDQRGWALSSPVALVSAAAVVVAGAAFFATGEDDPAVAVRQVTEQASSPPAPKPTSKAPKPVIEKKKPEKKKPTVRRGATYVEVYNNSGIQGLAGRTADRASGAGWQVVGSDNWYGTIPASTIYFPPRLKQEAKLLARDLGVHRKMPAISPMRFDRLTVILTSDYTS